jgi:HD-GYP domain-containing protein (c-di-GMP phosphodiesterase class II)
LFCRIFSEFEKKLGVDVRRELSWVDDLFASLKPQEFLSGMDLGITFQNAEGVVVGCNNVGAALLGRPREEILGRLLTDLPWTDDVLDFSQLADAGSQLDLDANNSASSKSRVLGIMGPDHSVRWLMLSAFPIIAEGVRKGAMISYRDVTTEHLREQSMEMMSEINRLIIISKTDDEFLKGVCDAFVRVGGYALARVDDAVDDDAHSVRQICFAGNYGYVFGAELSWAEDVPSGRGPIGTALRTGVAVQIDDLFRDKSAQFWRGLMKKFNLRSCVSIPLTLSSSRAVLSVYSSDAYAFPGLKFQQLQEMVTEIEFVAAYVSSMVATANALEGTIAALSRMTKARDPYTAGHQASVGSLGEAIAQRLGLEPSLCTLIRQSGELHDIGKIAVPVEILTRPGRLAKTEVDLIRTHPVVGADILARVCLPWPIVDVALQHHERLDGSGYPFGLKGDDVIMPARIIAVADVIDAMTQRRPYRPALGSAVALAEIDRGAGIQYDADVVATCLEIFSEGFTFAHEAEPRSM